LKIEINRILFTTVNKMNQLLKVWFPKELTYLISGYAVHELILELKQYCSTYKVHEEKIESVLKRKDHLKDSEDWWIEKVNHIIDSNGLIYLVQLGYHSIVCIRRCMYYEYKKHRKERGEKGLKLLVERKETKDKDGSEVARVKNPLKVKFL